MEIYLNFPIRQALDHHVYNALTTPAAVKKNISAIAIDSMTAMMSVTYGESLYSWDKSSSGPFYTDRCSPFAMTLKLEFNMHESTDRKSINETTGLQLFVKKLYKG